MKMKLTCCIVVDSRRRKLPVPHVHKAEVCFTTEDIPPELPWTPDKESEDQPLDSEEHAGSQEESRVEGDDEVEESEDSEESVDSEESKEREDDEESEECNESEENEETKESVETGEDEDSDEDPCSSVGYSKMSPVELYVLRNMYRYQTMHSLHVF